MVSVSTRWLPCMTIELTTGPWACAMRAVNDTAPTLNNIPPRTRQAIPSPRASHLPSFIPQTPLSSPSSAFSSRHSRERSSLAPESPPKATLLVQAFRSRATNSPCLVYALLPPISRIRLRRGPLPEYVQNVVVGYED